MDKIILSIFGQHSGLSEDYEYLGIMYLNIPKNSTCLTKLRIAQLINTYHTSHNITPKECDKIIERVDGGLDQEVDCVKGTGIYKVYCGPELTSFVVQNPKLDRKLFTYKEIREFMY